MFFVWISEQTAAFTLNINWFFITTVTAFTLKYALIPHKERLGFIFKGLIVVRLGVIISVTCCYSWHGRKSAKQDYSAMVYEQLIASTDRCPLWVENN